MLVFTRKIDQEIVVLIPDQPEIVIKYTCLHRNGRIRLAIEAPRDVTIHRRELWERIKARAKLVQSERPG